MVDAVTSPPKSESELTELEAIDRAFVPTLVEAETETGPVVTTEPASSKTDASAKASGSRMAAIIMAQPANGVTARADLVLFSSARAVGGRSRGSARARLRPAPGAHRRRHRVQPVRQPLA